MAQGHLARLDSDPRVAPVGRQTVAHRMETLAVRDPRALLRRIGDLLRRADGHRPLALASCQHPWGWPVQGPGGAQRGQQAGGAQRRAILAACPLLAAEQQARTCASRELQPDDGTDA